MIKDILKKINFKININLKKVDQATIAISVDKRCDIAYSSRKNIIEYLVGFNVCYSCGDDITVLITKDFNKLKLMKRINDYIENEKIDACYAYISEYLHHDIDYEEIEPQTEEERRLKDIGLKINIDVGINEKTNTFVIYSNVECESPYYKQFWEFADDYGNTVIANDMICKEFEFFEYEIASKLINQYIEYLKKELTLVEDIPEEIIFE